MSTLDIPESTKEISIPALGSAIKRVGPAFFLAAVMLGPGSIILSTLNGALLGYQMLWILVMSAVFITVWVEMIGRMGIVAEDTIWHATREIYGPAFGVLAGLFGIATAFGFQTGNILGASLAADAILGFGGVSLWGTVIVGLAIFLLLLPELYDKLERFVVVLVGLMAVAFIGTLIIAGTDPAAASSGVIPSFPGVDGMLLAIGMMSAYFSIYGALYQNYLVKEKGYGKKDLGSAMFDTMSAMIIVGILLITILLTSAAILNPEGIVPENAAEMAIQLEPLVGSYASLLFGLGLFAAGVSSVVVNALLGATLFVDGFGMSPRMETDESLAFGLSPVKTVALVILFVAWALAVVPNLLGASAIDIVVIAYAVSIIGLPYFGFFVLRLANNKSFMGKFTNTLGRNVLAVGGYLASIVIAIQFVFQVI